MKNVYTSSYLKFIFQELLFKELCFLFPCFQFFNFNRDQDTLEFKCKYFRYKIFSTLKNLNLNI